MDLNCRTIKVEFRDGRCLVVAEENWLTGVTLVRLQKAAADTLESVIGVERQYFHISTYPKLTACVVEGKAPSEEEAIMMPTTEMGKWFEAVKELNPHWFPEIEESKPDPVTEKKRKPRKRK